MRIALWVAAAVFGLLCLCGIAGASFALLSARSAPSAPVSAPTSVAGGGAPATPAARATPTVAGTATILPRPTSAASTPAPVTTAGTPRLPPPVGVGPTVEPGPTPPAAGLRVVITQITPVVGPGGTVSLTALTAAGAACELTSRSPGGTVVSRRAQAPEDGTVRFSWATGLMLGTGTATVECRIDGESAEDTAQFRVAL